MEQKKNASLLDVGGIRNKLGRWYYEINLGMRRKRAFFDGLIPQEDKLGHRNSVRRNHQSLVGSVIDPIVVHHIGTLSCDCRPRDTSSSKSQLNALRVATHDRTGGSTFYCSTSIYSLFDVSLVPMNGLIHLTSARLFGSRCPTSLSLGALPIELRNMGKRVIPLFAPRRSAMAPFKACLACALSGGLYHGLRKLLLYRVEGIVLCRSALEHPARAKRKKFVTGLTSSTVISTPTVIRLGDVAYSLAVASGGLPEEGEEKCISWSWLLTCHLLVTPFEKAYDACSSWSFIETVLWKLVLDKLLGSFDHELGIRQYPTRGYCAYFAQGDVQTCYALQPFLLVSHFIFVENYAASQDDTA
nr:hypothetical protein Iba_chr02fCG10760 [Ipomoea batatas]